MLLPFEAGLRDGLKGKGAKSHRKLEGGGLSNFFRSKCESRERPSRVAPAPDEPRSAKCSHKCSHDATKEKRVAASLLQPVDFIGGVDGARTRDPRRDRPVF